MMVVNIHPSMLISSQTRRNRTYFDPYNLEEHISYHKHLAFLKNNKPKSISRVKKKKKKKMPKSTFMEILKM